MRTIDLDQLAERLLSKSKADSLDRETVARLRDVVLWETTLEILGNLGSWAFEPDRLRRTYGDGTGMRRAFEPTDIYRADRDADALISLTTSVIREGNTLMPTDYARKAIEGTLRVAELVRVVTGEDGDYRAPEELLAVLCAATALALRRPPSVHREGGKVIVERAFANAETLARALPAY